MASLKTRGVALVTLVSFVFQSFLVSAQGLIVDASAGSNNAQLRAAGSVPVIDIAPPSARGLSHNRFSRFHVGTQGVVVNNSAVDTQTHIAGSVAANSRLVPGSEARVILNEVTGTSYSALRGVTEIAGAGAEYILANPNGIWCNGCGFVNTPDVTIATGRIGVLDGQVRELRVRDGWVVIDREGLQAPADAGLNVISRYIRVNGDINTGSINMLAGSNTVDLQTGTVTADANPAYYYGLGGIDSTAVGGMHAGQIRLVANESGVGVNMSQVDLAATRGDIIISADGKLTIGPAAAADDLALHSASSDIEIANTAFAGGSAKLTAAGSIAIDENGVLAAKHNVRTISDALSSAGTVVAGAGLDSTTADSGLLWISAANAIASRGSLQAGALIVESAGGDINNDTGAITADSMVITSPGAITNNLGSIEVAQAFSVEVDRIDNRAGRIISGGESVLSAETDIDNSAGLMLFDAANALVDAGGELNNTAGTLLHTGSGMLTVATAGGVDNTEGRIGSAGAIGLAVSGAFANASGELSARSVGGDIGSVDNRDGVIEGVAIALEVRGDLDNQAGLVSVVGKSADGLYLAVDGTIDNSGGAILSDAESGLLTANIIRNISGEIAQQGEGTLVVGVDDFINTGTLVSTGALAISAATISNAAGAISSGGLLELFAVEQIDNRRGLLQSQSGFRVVARSFDNSEGVTSNLGLQSGVMEIAGTLSNGGGVVQSTGQHLDIVATEVDNAYGEINHAGSGWLGIQGTVQGGNGAIYSQGSVDVFGADLVFDQSELMAAGSIFLWAGNTLSNDGGAINAGAQLDVVANTISNRHGLFKAAGESSNYFTAADLFDNLGGAVAGNRLLIDAGTVINNMGAIVGGDELLVSAIDLSNIRGRLDAVGLLSIDAENLDNGSGEISADEALAIALPADAVVGGDIFSGVVTQLSVSGDYFLAPGATLAGEGSLQIDMPDAAVFHNDGSIHFTGNIVGSGDSFVNGSAATLSAGYRVELHFNDILNQGLIESGTDMLLAGSNIENHGNLISGAGLAMNAQFNIANYGQAVAADNLSLLSPGTIQNHGGSLTAGADIVVAGDNSGAQAAQLLNASGHINAGDRLLVSAGQILNQRSQIHITNGTDAFGVTGIRYSDPLCSSDCTGYYELTEYVGNVADGLSEIATLSSAGDMILLGENIENSHAEIISGGDLLLSAATLTNTGTDLLRAQRTTRWDRSGQAATTLSGVDAQVLAYNRAAVGEMSLDNGAGYRYNFANGGDYFRYLPYYRDLGWSAEAAESGAATNELDALRALSVLSSTEESLPGNGSSGGVIRVAGDLRANIFGSLRNTYVDSGLERRDAASASITASVIDIVAGDIEGSGSLLADDLLFLASGGELVQTRGELSGGSIVLDVATDTNFSAVSINSATDIVISGGGNLLLDATYQGDSVFASDIGSVYSTSSSGPSAISQLTAGRDIDMRVFGDIDLRGTELAAGGALKLGAGGSINIAGVMDRQSYWLLHVGLQPWVSQYLIEQLTPTRLEAGGPLDLLAGGDISLDGSLLNSNSDVSIRSAQGVVDIAAAKLMQVRSPWWDSYEAYEEAESTRVTSVGSISIAAPQVSIDGSQIDAQDGIGVFSGADIELLAATLTGESSWHNGYGTGWEIQTEDHLVASLISAGNIDLLAGASISSAGASIAAGEDILLLAETDIDFSAVANTREYQAWRLWTSESEDTLQHEFGWVTTGGDIDIVAGGNAAFAGIQINTGSDISISAGGDISISAVTDTREYFYSKHQNDKKTRHQIIEEITRSSELNAGQSINISSGLGSGEGSHPGDISIVGSRLHAGLDIDINAGRDLILSAARDVYRSYYEQKNQGFLGGSGSGTTVERVTNIPVVLASGANIDLRAKRNIALQAGRVAAGNRLKVSSVAGQLALLVATDIDSYSHESFSSSGVWQSVAATGHYDTDVLMSVLTAPGGISLNAGRGIYVEHLGVPGKDYSEREVLEATLDQLISEDVGYAWLGELKERDDVAWQHVVEIHEAWDYEQQGLSDVAAAVVAIVASAYGGAAAAGWAESAGYAGWSAAAITGAAGAGSSIAASSLLNNQGDLGAVLQDMFSTASLQSIATSALTSGILQNKSFANSGFSFDADYFVDAGKTSLVSAAIDFAVAGENFADSFTDRLIAYVVQDAGKSFAQAIGAEYSERLLAAGGSTGDLSTGEYWAHKAKHAALGCALGEITSDSCAGGAVGGFVGEIIAEQYHSFSFSDSQLSNTEAIGYNQLKTNGVALAQIGGMIAASAAGQNIGAASFAAVNAAENNAFFLAIVPALGIALEALDKYLIGQQLLNLEEAINEGDDQRAADIAEELAIEAGVEFTVGHLIPGSQIAANLLVAIKRKAANFNSGAGDFVSKRYTPLEFGPLGDPNDINTVAATFRSGSYSEVVTAEPTKLYRVFGGEADSIGSYWTDVKPLGPDQSRLDSALLSEWQNTAVQYVEIEVPANVKLYTGRAASQRGVDKPFEYISGGGNQVYIPAENFDSQWVENGIVSAF